MPLTPTADPAHDHFATDVVYFYMSNRNQRVRCDVTRLALELLEPDLPPTKQGRIQAFQTAPRKHLSGPPAPNSVEVEPDGRTVLVRVVDLV